MENQYSTRRDFLKQASAGLAGIASLFTAGALANGCATATAERKAYKRDELIKEKIGDREIESIELRELHNRDGSIPSWACICYFENGGKTILKGEDPVTEMVLEKYKSKVKGQY